MTERSGLYSPERAAESVVGDGDGSEGAKHSNKDSRDHQPSRHGYRSLPGVWSWDWWGIVGLLELYKGLSWGKPKRPEIDSFTDVTSSDHINYLLIMWLIITVFTYCDNNKGFVYSFLLFFIWDSNVEMTFFKIKSETLRFVFILFRSFFYFL